MTKIEGDYDVFGDGSVMIISTPGHTPGHQALLVRLPKTGALVLSGDAVHFKANWDNRRVPSMNVSKEQTLASMQRIADLLEKEHGPDHAALIPYLQLLGGALIGAEVEEGAVRVFERVLRISETAALPEHPDVHVAVGAGHAFKFASLIGRVLSELVIDGRTESDISRFSISRSILRMEAPPRTYMV